MTIFQRFRGVIIGLGTILLGLVMIFGGENVYGLIINILGLVLLFTGLRYLIYYFRTGRFVVGGRMLLYLGIIMFDFGIFTMSLTDEPLVIVVIYLIAFYAFAGLIDILRAFEAKKQGAPWKSKLFLGIIEVAVAGLSLYFGLVLRSPDDVVIVYGCGLLVSGIMRIVNSFRRTAIVYIQ